MLLTNPYKGGGGHDQSFLCFQSDLRDLAFRFWCCFVFDSAAVTLSDRTTRCSPFQVSEVPSSLSRCIQCGPDATSFPAEEEKQEVSERGII